MSESRRGRCRVAWFVAALLLVSGPAFAGPDPDGAVDALISTPLDPIGDAVGAAGLMTASVIGLAGDTLALLDRNPYGGEFVLRGILSRPVRRTAVVLSQTSTGMLEGFRADDFDRFPEPADTYLDAKDATARVDTAVAALGCLGLVPLDALANPALFLTRASGLTGAADAVEHFQTNKRTDWVGAAQ
jgi:hypothetical protein